MAGKKSNYEDRFSGRTHAIIRTLTNIFIDSGLDVREKHMFGHKAFLVNGHTMMLVGEWVRAEKAKLGVVEIGSKGVDEPTLIIMPLDGAAAESFKKQYGGLYFAPSGTRLKNWLSLTGSWLADEAKLAPLVQKLLKSYSQLPFKEQKNPGYLL